MALEFFHAMGNACDHLHHYNIGNFPILETPKKKRSNNCLLVAGGSN